MNCIILAKGQESLRLGLDKAFLNIKGERAIDLLVKKIKPLFDTMYLVSNFPEKFQEYEGKKIKVLKDELRCGPIGAIYTGLKESNSYYNFVLAVDHIFVNKDIIFCMLNKKKKYDILIPKIKEFIQPLCGIYSKRIIKILEKRIKKGRYKLREVFDEVKTEYIENELKKFGNPEILFFNLNTKKDLQIANYLWEKSIKIFNLTK